MQPSRSIDGLVAIMAKLRTPGEGCAWDLAQDFSTIAPYTIEEAYEVAEAIARGDRAELKDELGDLLLQVVFHARMAEEEGSFALPDVIEAITTKLIRRHPHVFGDAKNLSPEAVNALWAQIKASEKAEKAHASAKASPASLLDAAPSGLPAVARAQALQKIASKVGFDWGAAGPALEKAREELEEVAEALELAAPSKIYEEIGDALFALVNVARLAGVDPEGALRRTNAKFERRFHFIEEKLAADGVRPENAGLERMDALWNAAKKAGL